MADKATKKKADKKVDKKAELDLSKLPLPDQLKVKQNELLQTQKSLHDGTLHNPHAIKTIKREIARILTKMNSQTADNATANNEEKGAN